MASRCHDFRNATNLLAVAMSAPLIAVNWTIFVWAIEVDRLTDASLGYFLNPLMFIVGGVVVFQERLSRVQMVALVIAVAGVAYLTIRTGELVWLRLRWQGPLPLTVLSVSGATCRPPADCWLGPLLCSLWPFSSKLWHRFPRHWRALAIRSRVG